MKPSKRSLALSDQDNSFTCSDVTELLFYGNIAFFELVIHLTGQQLVDQIEGLISDREFKTGMSFFNKGQRCIPWSRALSVPVMSCEEYANCTT
ncbi:hypothetical protein [Methanospirillum lacunae]|uniref:Uncharacterized protein n=1 Tax=Methanospirillum lacunae TaxID=668570 RepID=A0A2V2N4C8_9EURY|nr:hypothetical protein [Methanospirillum lacunae]PWR74679.1 hypothetical protein DK846_00035 [Methanospirillum lacunae]